MKKAFNFKKLLVCVLILILCLSAFVACDKDKGQDEQPYDANGINMAANALRASVRGSKVSDNFTLDNHQVYAGVTYPITWTISANDGQPTDVTLSVDGDKTNVIVNGKTKTEVKFALTATLSDAKGVTATVEIKYTIVAYNLLTYDEYIATKKGENVTIQGIVSHYVSKSNGASASTMYLYDEDGGYYVYSFATGVDPANIKGLHLGAKVEINGKKDIYNGTHEITSATVKVIDTTLTPEYLDITEVFKSAQSNSDAAFAKYQYRLVTIKNVHLSDKDPDEALNDKGVASHNYYFFENAIGGNVETYIRLNYKGTMMTKDEEEAFKTAFKADRNKWATIQGCVELYSGQLYINPVSATPYVVVDTEGKNAQEQVNFAKDNTVIQTVVSGNGSTIKLPTQDGIFSNVKIAWTADNNDIVKIENGVATFTFLTDNTVKLTATLTHSEDANATATKDFTITLKGAELITIAELYNKEVGDTAYYVEGYVVAVDKAKDGKRSFVLQDGTASIFSYNKADVKLGDHVKVLAKRSSDDHGFPQLGTLSFEKLADGAFTPQETEMQVKDVGITKDTAPEDLYTKKLWKITGSTLVKGSYGYQGNYNGSQVLSLKLNEDLETVAKSLEGKNVVIYGYSRGINTSVGYFTVQVTKIEEAQMTDAEKVASVKASLSDLEVKKGFDLPTSEIATISWSKVSGDGATLEGNHVTITRTDVDQTVVFRAEISCGTESDTKDITVTIKANEVVDPNTVIVTAESLGIVGKTYGDSAAEGVVINGVTFKFEELCENGSGIQTRNKNGKASKIWNTTATNKPIAKLIVKLYDGKAGFSNKDTHTITFGNAVNGNAYSTTLSTVKDQYEYEIIPDAATYTFFTFAHNASYTYSSYFESITVVYAQEVVKTDAEKVAEIKAGLELATTTTATDFNLPTTDVEGATITWASNHAEIIAFEGNVAKVTAPAAETVVTLTATITVGEATDTKDFNVTITVTIPEYDVTVGTLENGTLTVTVDGEAFTGGKLQQGKVLVIAVDVTAGYEIVEVKVNGTALTVGTDGKYTYTVNDAPVEITATAREIKYATVTVGTVDNGTLDVKVGDVAVEADKQYRDGTVLTITATANAGYKLVAVKVNGEKLTGNTYTIKETDTALEITVEINEIQAMTIAEFKASADKTEAKVTGIVTNIDSKATWIQDTEGNALYVYATKLAGVEVGKKVTLTGIKGVYNGLLQLKTPVVVKVEDTTDTIAPVVLDEAAYKALTANDAAKLVNVNGLVYVSGTANTDKGGTLSFKLGETTVSVRVEKGDAAALNSAVLSRLKSGDKVNLTNVNIGWFNSAQIALSAETQVEVVWDLEAVSDKTELVVNGTATITATITPAYMAEKVGAITFSTSDDKVLTVDNTNGTVTAVGVGEDAYIIVSAGGKTVNVPIKVVAAASAYTVTYSVDGGNGSITSVMAGENPITSGVTTVGADTVVTVTVTPDEGYRLASVKVGDAAEDTSVAGKTTFTLKINANTVLVVKFEVKPAAKTWQKVTDASTLAVGDTITLVYETKTMEMGGVTTTKKGGYVTNVSYTGLPTGAFAVTLENGAGEGTFALKTADGKYLSSDDGNNLYAKETTVTDATSWTVSFDKDGNVVITNVSTSRIIRYNTGSPRFAAYKSDSSVNTPIQLYKLA